VVDDNVRATVERLLADSPLLEQRVNDGRLAIVGARYSLETGAVEFL
jgi:carbonic anhydrase